MKHELELKVQAWLDGELPDVEARRIGQWIVGDAEAAALAAELGGIRQAMFRHEAPVVLEESRAFYWSKIERQMRRETSVRSRGGLVWHARWRRYLASAAGALALGCVVLLAVRQNSSPTFDEISSTAEGIEAVTFHDQAAQMTVVWLQDNSAPAQDQAAPKPVRYEDEPGTVVDLE